MDYFIKVHVVLAALYVFYHLVLRRSAYFGANRVFLLGGLAASFLLPAVDLPPGTSFNLFKGLPLPESSFVESLSGGSSASGQNSPEIVHSPETRTAGSGLLITTAPETSSGQSFDFSAILSGWARPVYLVIAGLLLLKILFFLYRILVHYRNNRVVKREGYRLVLLKDPHEPAFSFFSIIFINPADLRQRNNWILRHELVHVRQFHSLDILLSEVVKAILWINPFAYLYQHALRSVNEYMADAIVQPEEKDRYAKLMYDYSFRGRRISLQNSFFNKTLLKRRIIMLYQKKTWKMRAAYLLAFPLLAALAAFTSGKQPAVQSTGPTGPSVRSDQTLSRFITVSGTVTDATGRPLAGASVFLKGTSGGTATDAEGHFKLMNVPGDSQLRFSMIGYEDQLIPLNSSRIVNIRLLQKRERLKDISVVGYTDAEEGKEEIASRAPAAPENGKTVYPFTSIEKMPLFPGGNDQILGYIGREFRYPEEARRDHIGGVIEVGFVVDEEGRVTKPEVLKGIGAGCDEELLRLIKAMPKWEPGEQNGVKVPVYYVLPLNLKVI